MGEPSGRDPPPIRRLEEGVVNRIAAGEVIQRPASALKEMLENSLDAGATQISVVVKDGGLKMLQITDNGHGIRYEDLPILCERHTTSKLQAFEDLQTISTLGFRGEALASISFVAHLTVTSMTEGQGHGFRSTYKDGKLEAPPKACAAVKGTQLVVEDLFYNVAARRKAFKSPAEEYSRILDVISRYAVHRAGVSFACKKHGDSRADIHTVLGASRLDAIKAVFGPAVARELIPLEVPDQSGTEADFTLEGFISSANYSAKKTTFVLFINDRLVDCSPLKKACEAVYAAILPKASKPFLYLSLKLPSQNVDVNVHPTKREVGFLHQEELIDAVQEAVEAKLLDSNTSRTFYTQTVLPGVSTSSPPKEKEPEKPSQAAATQKAPDNKLVRTDVNNPAGRLHAFMQRKPSRKYEETGDLAATRRSVRQRRNPSEAAELTSVQELLLGIDRKAHQGLSEVLRQYTFVGLADDDLALIQHQTKLYLVNVVMLSKELVYQQILRRFGRCLSIRLSQAVSLKELLLIALDEEERQNRWHPDDGPKQEIAQALQELLVQKAEMLLEYFSIEIDGQGQLLALPLILDQYTPDLDRLPQFALTLSNDVNWDSEKECFETLAAALADFYAVHPPLIPHPEKQSPDKPESTSGQEADPQGVNTYENEDKEEAEAVWAEREWIIQHLIFPAMRLFLRPPSSMATDGTVLQVACLEQLYKVFERC